ncbi:hypothetical protein [Prosthecodimorpha staleyi]|uniref:Uncharacterized protein n=1 Tax=Prosthecodimorpha staleyi TaxID=2840188 RepID=A0A947D1D4_9HYPH|nr:hypothetical protein [Prosthecodimorpha staleyi]MBT9289153.1 hypothetical protein [Prosthecodimorpha staleyi]
MMELRRLRPSEFRLLGNELANGAKASAFLAALKACLKSVNAGDAADADDLFVMSRKLSAAGVWDQMPVDRLTATLHRASRAAVDPVIDGMPQALAENIRSLLDAMENDELRRRA